MGKQGRTAWFFAVVGVLTLLSSGQAWAWYDASTTSYSWYAAPTVLSGAKCDNCSAVVTLPFSFPFYGTAFTQVTVSSNGYVILGSDTANGNKLPPNRALGFAGADDVPDNLIAALWDNWNPAYAGNVYTGSPAADSFVIEWRDVAHYGATSGRYTFELKLFASGRFEVHYKTVTGQNTAYDKGVAATVGYQLSKYTVGEGIHYRTDSLLANSTAIGRTPPAAAAFVRAVDPFLGAGRDDVVFQQPNVCSFNCLGYDKFGVAIRGTAGVDKFGNPYPQPICPETVSVSGVTSVGRGGWVRLSPSCPAGDWFSSWTGTPSIASYWDAAPYPGPYETISGGAAKVYQAGAFYAAHQFVNPRPNKRDVWLMTYATKSCTTNNYTSTANAAAWVTSTQCPLGDNQAAANVSPDPKTRYGYCYQNQCRFRSKLDYYYGFDPSTPITSVTTYDVSSRMLSVNAHTKAIVVAPGIDSLNDDAPGEYYMLMNPLRTSNAANSFAALAELQRKGVGILIGDYGDGHRHLSKYLGELNTWVSSGYTFAGSRPVVLAGVSMGGQLVKMAVKSTIATTKIKSVMTLDSPLRGANLGSATRSLQTLVACEAYNSENFWTLYSPPAMDMKTESPYYCGCRHDSDGEGRSWEGTSTGGSGTWPEDSYCLSDNGAWHNSVYGPYATWKSGVKRFAAANGDGTGPSFANKSNTRHLYEFDYDYFYCDDEDWDVTKLDCYPGSSYVHPNDVAQSGNTNLFGIPGLGCGGVDVSMNFSPTFIPVNSALDTNPVGTCYDTCHDTCYQSCDKYGCTQCPNGQPICTSYDKNGACAQYSACTAYECNIRDCNPHSCERTCPSTNYPVITSLNPAGWASWAANDANWPHCEVSGYLSCKMYSWTLAEFGVGAPVACQTNVATTTGSNVPNTQCSARP